MIKRFFKSKLFFLLISLFIIGFFIGYDYSILSTKKAEQILMEKKNARQENTQENSTIKP